MDAILDVDLLAFEEGTAAERSAVVDGTMRSLETGFVYTAHDVSSGLIDQAYEMLATFFALDGQTKRSWTADGTHGQTGYTGLLVETAATSDEPDWKEMLNWGERIPTGHPLRTQFPNRYHEPVLPEADVPGITETLLKFHSSIADIQRRFLRIIAVGVGADETLFDETVAVGANLTRAIRYPPMEQAPGGSHVWAGAHADINLITALPRATARGLQVEIDGTWVDAIPPDGYVIINTGLMLERLTNGRVPSGMHRVVADPEQPGQRLSVVQFCHPAPWTMLTPIPSCVTPERPLKYLPIRAADALDEVLWQINLVEDGRRVEGSQDS
ncbi:isopenicillin N synthase family oxygenase [bacterium]|nr:isopenicillin N synthase family oxygenase [bacterium]